MHIHLVPVHLRCSAPIKSSPVFAFVLRYPVEPVAVVQSVLVGFKVFLYLAPPGCWAYPFERGPAVFMIVPTAHFLLRDEQHDRLVTHRAPSLRTEPRPPEGDLVIADVFSGGVVGLTTREERAGRSDGHPGKADSLCSRPS